MPRSWLDLTGFQYYIHLSFTLSESPGIDSRNHPKFESGRCREAGLILCITERGLSKGQTKKTCQIELQQRDLSYFSLTTPSVILPIEPDPHLSDTDDDDDIADMNVDTTAKHVEQLVLTEEVVVSILLVEQSIATTVFAGILDVQPEDKMTWSSLFKMEDKMTWLFPDDEMSQPSLPTSQMFPLPLLVFSFVLVSEFVSMCVSAFAFLFAFFSLIV